jgi:hypothetical protein
MARKKITVVGVGKMYGATAAQRLVDKDSEDVVAGRHYRRHLPQRSKRLTSAETAAPSRAYDSRLVGNLNGYIRKPADS